MDSGGWLHSDCHWLHRSSICWLAHAPMVSVSKYLFTDLVGFWLGAVILRLLGSLLEVLGCLGGDRMSIGTSLWGSWGSCWCLWGSQGGLGCHCGWLGDHRGSQMGTWWFPFGDPLEQGWHVGNHAPTAEGMHFGGFGGHWLAPGWLLAGLLLGAVWPGWLAAGWLAGLGGGVGPGFKSTTPGEGNRLVPGPNQSTNQPYCKLQSYKKQPTSYKELEKLQDCNLRRLQRLQYCMLS